MKLPLKTVLLAILLAATVLASACSAPLSVIEPTATTRVEQVAPTLTADPSEPTQEPALTPAVKGYVLLDVQKQEFHGYAADGSLAFTSQAPGLQYVSPFTTQPVDGAVYFANEQDKQLYRSSPGGVEQVKFTIKDLYAIAVSQDEKQIAWSTLGMQGQSSELYMANIDGSDAHRIASSDMDKPSMNFLYVPLEWTADGKLLYNLTGVGFGGYIPFGGYNSLYRYDPASGQVTTIVPAEEQHGLCLDAYRLDLGKIAFNCSRGGPSITIRNLEDQSESIIWKRQSGNNLAGSARFSPSGKWLAYATAAGNPDNESGQVFVLPADLTASAQRIADVGDNSYPYVEGWLDENTLLYMQNQGPSGTAWTIHKDGTGGKQVASGLWVGWIP